MPSQILFVGGEDLNFTVLGSVSAWTVGTPVSNSASPFWYIDSTAGRFRSGYSRHALSLVASSQQASAFIRSNIAFSSSNFWTSARMYSGPLSGANSGSGSVVLMRWADSGGIVRLQIKSNGGSQPGNTVLLQTVNAAGTATTVATSTGTFGTSSPGTPDKIDVYVNYAVSGTFTVYSNGTQIATYSGDITTNGVTSLSYVDLGQACSGTNLGSNGATSWSECAVATRDTRNLSVVTQVATANGNADTFAAGTAANLASTSMTTGQASPNYSISAGQIQEYTVTPALPVGSFSVVSVVHTALATIGASGPTKFDFMVRTGGTDFVSSDIAPSLVWAAYSFNWDTNPNTGNAWQTSELPNASASFNLGLKSVA
jgi:hypothetical protein